MRFPGHVEAPHGLKTRHASSISPFPFLAKARESPAAVSFLSPVGLDNCMKACLYERITRSLSPHTFRFCVSETSPHNFRRAGQKREVQPGFELGLQVGYDSSIRNLCPDQLDHWTALRMLIIVKPS